ncbi:MAG TPA: BrnT family toxin, partial [Chitinispirillaceae bacterium]|nr:BrnT family toxin [Chitinispirillaceae bacterium]
NYRMQHNIEWDLNKAHLNFQKHKISFEVASTVFLDPNALTIYDEEHNEDEDRWVTVGICSRGTVIVVSHTFRQRDGKSIIRIFSSRKATKREINKYRSDLD